MKLYWIFIAAILLQCKEETPVDCSGFIGGGVEDLLISHGAANLAEAYTQYRSDPGAFYRITCGASFGRDGNVLAGQYTDHDQSNIAASRSGIIKLNGVPFTQIGPAGNPFKLTNNRQTVLDLFGSEVQLKQFSFDQSIVLNQTSLRLPLPFSANGIVSQAQQSNGALVLSWPPDPHQSHVIVLVSSFPENGDNADLGLEALFYKIYKIPNNGAFTVPAADLAPIPAKASFAFHLVRYQTKTITDSREPGRKNMVLAMSSVMGSMLKQ